MLHHEKCEKKINFRIIVLAFLIALISACAKQEAEEIQSVYPLKGKDAVITYALLGPELIKHYNSIPLRDELAKRTGINVKYINVYKRNDKYLELMIASNDLPDIIEMSWYGVDLGSGKSIDKNIIISLNECISKYSPNLKQYLKKNPDIDESVKTCSGDYYIYPFVRENNDMCTCRGAMIRKDILDASGIEIPETIDEWDTALRAMKNAGIEIPLSMALAKSEDPFLSAYNIASSFYLDDGRVKLGYYEKEFAQYLKQMKKWYDDGLLVPEFFDSTYEKTEELVLSGKFGATTSILGGKFGVWLSILKQQHPEIHYAPVRYATAKKGVTPMIGEKVNRVNGVGAAITTQCENRELAAKFLDYGYSEEGHMIYNFGILNESYEMIDGYPRYTEKIIGGDYRNIPQQMSNYIRANVNGPFIQDSRYLEQYYIFDEQKEAYKIWNETEATKHILPVLKFNPEEATKISRTVLKAEKLKEYTIYRIITGQDSFNSLDEYFKELKSIGIDSVIDMYQKAYDNRVKK